MKRRQLNKAMAYGWIGLNLGLLAGCGDRGASQPGQAPLDESALANLRQLASELRGVEFVAPVCFARLQDQAPLETLLASLPKSADTLAQGLRERIAMDFERGLIVDIDGWKISQGECLLLAGAASVQGLTEAREVEVRPYAEQPFMEIERWGPESTIAGEIFNPIGNGRGGFWLRVSSPVNGSMRLELGGQPLATHFEPGVITASLEPDYMEQIISEPGAYELVLLDNSRRLRQSVGFLTVEERPDMAVLADGSESRVFCETGAWGPNVAVEGEAFNRQPDGSASFWVRIGCAPDQAVLELDGVALETTVRPGLVTARVKHHETLKRGKYPLVIVDRGSGERLTIGQLTIQ